MNELAGEPPNKGTWTRYRGTLHQCVVKALDTYRPSPYRCNPLDQGDHLWRVLVPRLEIGSISTDLYDPQELVWSVAERPEQGAQPATLAYDTSWVGESIRTKRFPYTDLWVFAKLFIAGNNEPVALIYRIDPKGRRNVLKTFWAEVIRFL